MRVAALALACAAGAAADDCNIAPVGSRQLVLSDFNPNGAELRFRAQDVDDGMETTLGLSLYDGDNLVAWLTLGDSGLQSTHMCLNSKVSQSNHAGNCIQIVGSDWDTHSRLAPTDWVTVVFSASADAPAMSVYVNGVVAGTYDQTGSTYHAESGNSLDAPLQLYSDEWVLELQVSGGSSSGCGGYECNKNKHCDTGSFCACNTGSGACTDKDSVCQTCASIGRPSFELGTTACERYERGCGLTCDGSNYEASQACPGDRVWLDCGTACEKVCGDKSDDVCTEQCVPACQCPKYTVLESADSDVCLRMKECRKRRKDDDDMTFWGFDDDGEDWYADKRKKTDDDDEPGATGSSSSSSNTSDGPMVEGAGLTVGCVFTAGILIGAAAMRLRQSKRRPPPTVELGQVIVAEEVLKDEPTRTDLQEPFPSVGASTPTARPV